MVVTDAEGVEVFRRPMPCALDGASQWGDGQGPFHLSVGGAL